jgi:carboxyl-terminal processing protease
MKLGNLNAQTEDKTDMAKSVKWRSFLRTTPLLLILGLGGVTTAITLGAPGFTLPSASGGSISDSPKEVIDQVWQIVYRDYLDSSGDYDESVMATITSRSPKKIFRRKR